MQIKSRKIPLSIRTTPSTFRSVANTYYFSIHEHIKRILNNPQLRSKLYFGAGVYTNTCEELWHGDIWAESPLFGQSYFKTTKGKITFILYIFKIINLFILGLFKSGEYYNVVDQQLAYGRIRSFIIYEGRIAVRVQRLMKFQQLPRIFKTANRYRNSSEELWLLEEYQMPIVDHSFFIIIFLYG